MTLETALKDVDTAGIWTRRRDNSGVYLVLSWTDGTEFWWAVSSDNCRTCHPRPAAAAYPLAPLARPVSEG